MNTSTREEEIHLADIAAVVYRRRWLIAAGTVAGIAFVVMLALLTPAKSQFRAVAEIGRLADKPRAAETDVDKILRLVAHMTRSSRRPDGYRYVEDPEEASERLIGYAYSVYQSRYDDQDIEPPFSVDKNFHSRMIVSSAGENTFLVEARLTAPTAFEDASVFVREVVEQLIAAHDEVVTAYEKELESDADRLRAQLVRANERMASLQRRLDGLAGERRQLQVLAEDLERRIREAEAAGNEPRAEGGVDRFEEFVFENELQRLRSMLDDVRVRLASGIPDRTGELQLEIDRTKTERERIESALEGLARAIDATEPTHLVAKPREGGRPVRVPYILYAVLGALMGGFLALFAAFVLEFWAGNRARITRT